MSVYAVLCGKPLKDSKNEVEPDTTVAIFHSPFPGFEFVSGSVSGKQGKILLDEELPSNIRSFSFPQQI